MREIKFRAWDDDEKQMLDWDALLGKDVKDAFDTSWPPLINVIDPCVCGCTMKLMQYTGLKDKNGVEIYEGDLIKFTEIDEDSAFGREDTEVVEVKWLEDIAQFRAIFKSGRRTELHFVVQLPTVVSCEVIGNIYENPELIDK